MFHSTRPPRLALGKAMMVSARKAAVHYENHLDRRRVGGLGGGKDSDPPEKSTLPRLSPARYCRAGSTSSAQLGAAENQLLRELAGEDCQSKTRSSSCRKAKAEQSGSSNSTKATASWVDLSSLPTLHSKSAEGLWERPRVLLKLQTWVGNIQPTGCLRPEKSLGLALPRH